MKKRTTFEISANKVISLLIAIIATLSLYIFKSIDTSLKGISETVNSLAADQKLTTAILELHEKRINRLEGKHEQ
jgi:hypothetical protein